MWVFGGAIFLFWVIFWGHEGGDLLGMEVGDVAVGVLVFDLVGSGEFQSGYEVGCFEASFEDSSLLGFEGFDGSHEGEVRLSQLLGGEHFGDDV